MVMFADGVYLKNLSFCFADGIFVIGILKLFFEPNLKTQFKNQNGKLNLLILVLDWIGSI